MHGVNCDVLPCLSAAPQWLTGRSNYTPGAEQAFKIMTKREEREKSASFFAPPSLLLFPDRRRAVSARRRQRLMVRYSKEIVPIVNINDRERSTKMEVQKKEGSSLSLLKLS